MRRLLVTAGFCLLLAYETLAQVYVDGVNINEQNITYCQLIGYNRGALNPTRIWVDYGQPNFATGVFKSPQTIADPDRRSINFNTVVEALNFMSRYGWELVSMNIAPGSEGGIGMYVYLLRKRSAEAKGNS